MSFWNRIKTGLRNFMQGRHGTDDLSMATFWAGLIMLVLSYITGIALFNLLSLALYVYTIFRTFSRNNEKRTMENQMYVQKTAGFRTKVRQFINRLKNSKQYKYFHCPKCRAMLRLTRGQGQVNVTCGRCGHQFSTKA